MYKKILTIEQIELLPLVQQFSKDYYLVGGTAIGLHIGHRRSIDFDLFTHTPLKKTQVKHVIEKTHFPIQHILYEDTDQLHLIVNSVKITFFYYPYPITADIPFENVITLPSLLDLAAMKANALGRRGKWKDYVDLYFLLKTHHSLSDISQRAKIIFQSGFNPKLFRQQLCYFDDVDFTEVVEYIGENVSEDDIKAFLTDVAISSF